MKYVPPRANYLGAFLQPEKVFRDTKTLLKNHYTPHCAHNLILRSRKNFERCTRSLTCYIKFENLIFENVKYLRILIIVNRDNA